MKKEKVKKAFTEAQKEVREKAVEQLKNFIKKTLEARERQINVRDEASRKIKILDKDIQDLKEGRIDRIEERQKADPKAKETSVAIVEKIKVVEHHHHHDYDRWYWPYQFTWTIPCAPLFAMTDSGVDINSTSGLISTSNSSNFTLNNSMAKDFTVGAYSISVNGDSEKISYVA